MEIETLVEVVKVPRKCKKYSDLQRHTFLKIDRSGYSWGFVNKTEETGRKGESADKDLKELDTLCVQGKQGGVGTVLTELWNNFLLEAGF